MSAPTRPSGETRRVVYSPPPSTASDHRPAAPESPHVAPPLDDPAAGAIERALTSPAAIRAILGVGVALRVVAWALRSSLWIDEAAIALNVRDRTLWELLTVRLDYGQAAPKGFLLLEWIVTRVAGQSEQAYRFVPLLAGIASLFLFRDVAARTLRGLGVPVALFFFAVGGFPVFYTAEAKPYALDLALSLLVVRLTLDTRAAGFPRRRVWALAAVGFASVWFSQFTVIALAALGVSLAALELRSRGVRGTVRTLWPLALPWGAGAALALWTGLRAMSPATAAYMREFHKVGMQTWTPKKTNDWLFFWNQWRGQLATWSGGAPEDRTWLSLFPALALIGMVGLVARRRGAGLLAIAPLLGALAAALAHQYPYTTRLILGAVVVLLLGIGESAGRLASIGRGTRWAPATQLAALLLCVPPAYRLVAFHPPFQRNLIHERLTAIRERWRPGDKLWVNNGTSIAFLYYAREYGFQPDDYVLGPCDNRDRTSVFRAVDRLRGQPRVWALIGNGRFFPQERDFGYLRAIGVQRDSVRYSILGSARLRDPRPYDLETAYLFDLSDPARLARYTAQSYAKPPLPARTPANRAGQPWWCYGVFRPLERESGIPPRE